MNLLTRHTLSPVRRWAEQSQRTACRNAMVASTALAARRREREEVQELVETLLAQRGLSSATVERRVAATG